MVLIGYRLRPDDFQAILEDSTVADALVYGDLDDDDAEPPEPELDVDKSWHALHYLLTGTAWEISDGSGAAILGGEEVGRDNGYGPARLLSPDTVRTIAAALDALNVETLRARFDPDAMMAARVYPEIWSGTDHFDDYLAPNFDELRHFYRTAADEDQAVLLALT